MATPRRISRLSWCIALLVVLGALLLAGSFRWQRGPMADLKPAEQSSAVPIGNVRLAKPIRIVVIGCVERKGATNLWYPSLRGALRSSRPLAFAKLTHVMVSRRTDQEFVKFTVNAEKLLAAGSEEADIELANGDVIFVPEQLI